MTRAGAVRTGLMLAVCAGLSACAMTGADGAATDRAETAQAVVPPATAMPGQLEPIRAAAVVNNLTVFWVTSNGCTRKEDLLPVVTTHGDASVITLRRLSEDRCKRPQDEGLEVRWSFEELGLKPGSTVTVNNPYQLSAGA